MVELDANKSSKIGDLKEGCVLIYSLILYLQSKNGLLYLPPIMFELLLILYAVVFDPLEQYNFPIIFNLCEDLLNIKTLMSF